MISFDNRLNVIYGRNGCLAEGTLVATPNGPKAIEALRIGDDVFDEHGNPIKILQTFNTGIKKVVELKSDTILLAKSTYDHVWLTKNKSSRRFKCSPVHEFYKGAQIIKRCFPKTPLGKKNVPDAYLIGAMLGDGCCVQSTSKYHISSATEEVPAKLAKILNCPFKKLNGENYTWEIDSLDKSDIYLEWVHRRKAHEKWVDLEEIKTWDRESCINFIAGIIDTDGSIHKKRQALMLSISMQAETVINALNWLFLALFQTNSTMFIDDSDKYVNGPCYTVAITRYTDVLRILQEIEPYLQVSRKKDLFTEINAKTLRDKPDRIGIIIGKESYEQTYDIHVDSDTNLYCLANGLVTHNSGKSVAIKTLAAYCGIEKGGWSQISNPAKLASKVVTHFPFVYRAYTPSNVDADVTWDGAPTFYNDSDMLNKNDFTWFFDNEKLSADGITSSGEQMDIMAEKPSSGQYRIHKINKIMKIIQTPPSLSEVPDVADKESAAAEVEYIKILRTNAKRFNMPDTGKMTLLFDEPEKALALPKQLELFDTLNKLSEHFQVIIATHSPFILYFKDANIIDLENGYADECRDLIEKQIKSYRTKRK
jgi:DNA-binding transcriptional regulator WhiA